jgi:signal transduction histidine kinase
VWIKKSEIRALSADIRSIIDGKPLDLRTNKEGPWGILRNDIHTLATIKNEYMATLEREHAAMTDTLANISHQLKTPLTSLNMMADLMEQELPDEPAKKFLTNIKISLTRMEWLATVLLKIAKLDAGAVEFAKTNIPAGELIQAALEPLHILLELKKQKTEISTENQPLIRCDKRWSAEALTNLIKNAGEHTPEGGTIRITSGANPMCTWISVADSGPGLSVPQQMNLFKRFAASQNDKGFGIGLPLALAIMNGQGGDIDVDGGRAGTGAVFTLKFYKV